MVGGNAALKHHLFEVTIGELVSAAPTCPSRDQRWLVVPPLERGLFCFTSMIPEE